ncbi:MAG: uncharacterized protein A8A55_3223 [Amphiamblys sp. WSBS2006]|nr:MAG: uncharacterized protein A8A55_3223 [Amphiamblys sp. WSBS2006]
MIPQRKIHVEDLAVTQNGKETGPETNTKIVVSKKTNIKGNPRVLLFLEFGPEVSHLDIDGLQRQCLSPEIDLPKIKIQLTENKITVRGNMHVLQFFKKKITTTEVSFFVEKGKQALERTKITLVSREMERIEFGGKGVSVLSSITNEKIDVKHMVVMDIACFPIKKKKK